MKSYRTSIVAAHAAKRLVAQLAQAELLSVAHYSYGCNAYKVTLLACPTATRITVVATGSLEWRHTHRVDRGVFERSSVIKLARHERSRPLGRDTLLRIERIAAHLFEEAREAALDPIHSARELVYLKARERNIDRGAMVATGRQYVPELMDLPTVRFWEQWLTSQPVAL